MDNYEDDILSLFTRRFTVHFVSEKYSDEDVFIYDCINRLVERLHTDFGLSYDGIVHTVADMCDFRV